MHTYLISTTPYSRVTIILFQIALATLPFSGLNGPFFMGELSRSLSVWFMVPALVFSFNKNFRHFFKCSAYFFIPLLACIFLSFILNMNDIFFAELRERSGLNKFFTSLLVIFYGMAISIFVSKIDSRDLVQIILKPVVAGVFVAAFFGLIEVLWWLIPSIEPIYSFVVSIVRPGYNHLEFWGRLTSVAFEPHALGLWLGFSFPVSLWLALKNAKPKFSVHSAILWFSCLCSLVMVWLSASRGGILVCAMVLFAYFAYNLLNFFKVKNSGLVVINVVFAIWLSVLFAQIFYAGHLSEIILSEDKISNLSRYAMNVTAFDMFFSKPLLGVGLGQFAFNSENYIPSWGWLSYEIQIWMIDQDRGWPSTYSLPGRILSELGIFGFLIWYVGIYFLFKRAIIIKSQFLDLFILLFPFVYYYGIPTETFAHVGLWVTLGLLMSEKQSNFHLTQQGRVGRVITV